jgi:hypothetical protein
MPSLETGPAESQKIEPPFETGPPKCQKKKKKKKKKKKLNNKKRKLLRSWGFVWKGMVEKQLLF